MARGSAAVFILVAVPFPLLPGIHREVSAIAVNNIDRPKPLTASDSSSVDRVIIVLKLYHMTDILTHVTVSYPRYSHYIFTTSPQGASSE